MSSFFMVSGSALVPVQYYWWCLVKSRWQNWQEFRSARLLWSIVILTLPRIIWPKKWWPVLCCQKQSYLHRIFWPCFQNYEVTAWATVDLEEGTIEEMGLQTFPKSSQWRRRRDVLQQSVAQLSKLYKLPMTSMWSVCAISLFFCFFCERQCFKQNSGLVFFFSLCCYGSVFVFIFSSG